MKNIFLLLVALAYALTVWTQGSLQIGAGATIKTSNGAYFVLDNMNIVNNGSFQQVAGNGFVKLTGAIDVSVSGSNAITIDELLLAKSGAATANLQSDLNIVSKVNFSGGLLNLNNSVLDLGSTGIFSSESEVSRAFTMGNGYAQASGILNKPSSTNLGNLGAAITSNTNLGSTTVRRGHQVQMGISGSNNSIMRYFDIMPTNNLALKATLRFYYFDAELNSIPETALYQWKSPNLVNWDFMGALLRDVNANYVEWKTYSKFDRVTLATATPPTITCPGNQTVSANMNGCKASVTFAATATGIPTPSIIYRIGNSVITSPNVFSKGTTTVTATASNGVAPDATCTFTVTVVCGGGGGPVTTTAGVSAEQETADKLTISARPNPSAHYFTVEVKSSDVKPVMIRITDVLGRVLSVRSNVAPRSTLYFGQEYLPGVYFVQAIQGKQAITLKLVKQAY